MFDFTCEKRFVVQEHHAKRAGLHNDIRIEARINGRCVLVSWATRKLHSLLEDKAKRIELFRTENHDMRWLHFEGLIDDGYGKGKVSIWDTGTYEILSSRESSFSIKFNGSKWKGNYAFVHLGKDKGWLLVKMKDQTREYKSLLTE